MANKTFKSLTPQGLDTTYKVPATAPEYSATNTYAVGDLAVYQGVLYKCTTAIDTPEAWTVQHWQDTTIGDEVSTLNESISGNLSPSISSYTENGTLTTTGAEAIPTDGIAVRTMYIEVNGGDKLNFLYAYNTQGRTLSAFRRICFYTDTKEFISRYEPALSGAYFDPYYYEFLETIVPSNAKYVRATLRTGGLPFTCLLNTDNNQFNTYAITNKSFYGTKYKSAFNGCIPVLHAGGYSGVYEENTVNNMMYNILNHPDDHRPKFAEVDTKPCSDNVWIVSHADTFEYEGTTYTIKETPSATAIAAGLPLFESFIKLAHQYGFEIMIDTGNTNTKEQFSTLVDIVKQYGMIPYSFIATGNRDDLLKLASIDPSLNLAYVLFRKLWSSDELLVKNLNKIITGNLMLYLEKETAITLSDADYINGYRKMGLSFGVHGFRNADTEILSDWAKICDYICIPQANAYDYILAYDYN